MSIENVYKLLSLGEKDAAVRTGLENSGAGEAGPQGVVALGKKHGLDFTTRELLHVVTALQQSKPSGGALSDDQLAQVSGGRSGGQPWGIPDCWPKTGKSNISDKFRDWQKANPNVKSPDDAGKIIRGVPTPPWLPQT